MRPAHVGDREIEPIRRAGRASPRLITGMQPKALPEAGNGEEARAPGIGTTAC